MSVVRRVTYSATRLRSDNIGNQCFIPVFIFLLLGAGSSPKSLRINSKRLGNSRLNNLCAGVVPFYGHGSSIRNLKEMVEYKNKAVPENPEVPTEQLADEFQALNLTEEEIDLIAEFLETGLEDKNLSRYLPAELPSGACFPNADPMSSDDLACSPEVVESLEAFEQMMKVVTHQRCINCHPSDNYPRQGEDSHVHNFGVERGENGHGIAPLNCSSCHQDQNNDISGIPGISGWHLAPLSMGWAGA